MAGIAGITTVNAVERVNGMLGRIRHRGKAGISVFEKDGTTMGMVWNKSEREKAGEFVAAGSVGEEISLYHYARVRSENGKFIMNRDDLGVAPLYYGKDKAGNMCFASEIKALLAVTDEISEMPPGNCFDGTLTSPLFTLKTGPVSEDPPEELAIKLRNHLDEAVKRCIKSEDIGSWLSGGVDSSAICALAARYLKVFKTFTAGVKGAPDLEFSREMARFIKSDHHELTVTSKELISNLPDVIFHLESFDALLVRSGILNFLVARMASDHVGEVFSGEGGDELFAGYEYLKYIPLSQLENELVKLTCVLHNTALQRVDRCASAFGTTAHVVFTDPGVVRFAFTIPVRYKLNGTTEKWILRKAIEDLLPYNIFRRPKAKFWEGAGVKELISQYAEKKIGDNEFRQDRNLSGGLVINTKEELLYYRIFSDHFGSDIDLSWLGRTKGSPVG